MLVAVVVEVVVVVAELVFAVQSKINSTHERNKARLARVVALFCLVRSSLSCLVLAGRPAGRPASWQEIDTTKERVLLCWLHQHI